MTVELRVTPHLPKLVESAARRCYNSFDKARPDGHKLVKNIMKMEPPHLSIGHHGNVLVCLRTPDWNVGMLKVYVTALQHVLLTLQYASHNHLTVSTHHQFEDSEFDAVISGNPVAWTNAYEYTLKMRMPFSGSNLVEAFALILASIFEPMLKAPETLFFLAKEEGYAIMDNPYNLKPNELSHDNRNKLLVYDDFSDILTPEECHLHETATVAMLSERVIAEQMNRHYGGISMMSQRYTLPFDMEGQTFKQFMGTFNQDQYDNIQFQYQVPISIDPDEPMDLFLEHLDEANDYFTRVELDNKALLWNSRMSYNQMMSAMQTFFFTVFFHQIKTGANHKRANEQARSFLTNNIDTAVYYTRPRWKWRHFIDLRVEKHAQLEVRRESIPLLKTLQTIGWFTDFAINDENLTATVKMEETPNEETTL